MEGVRRWLIPIYNKRKRDFDTACWAEKPLVQVKILPEFNAVCSTGKENVRPRCTTSKIWRG
jgi:hypothetical protein